MKPISKSRRMWGTYIATLVMVACYIVATTKQMESTATTFAAGIVALWMAYLGFESWKKSQH